MTRWNSGLERIASSELCAGHHDEPGQVPSVRLQQHGLEAVDLPVLLELRVVRDAVLEHLERELLTSAHDFAPAQE
jgi:hypothetical protein